MKELPAPSTLLSSRRASARAKVNASWADQRRTSASSSHSIVSLLPRHGRRAQQQQQQQQGQSTTEDTHRRPSQQVSLCRLIRHAWEQVALNVGSKLQSSSAKPKSSSSSSSSFVHLENNNNNSDKEKTRTFPSVLEMLQATAVASQVETMILQDESSMRKDPDSLDTAAERMNTRHTIMSLLPAAYDWNQAIQSSSVSRSRAFLLLDLAALVKAHWKWTRLLGNCALCYAVHHNRNEKLLALWRRLNVRLACTHSMDVEVAMEALPTTHLQSKANDSALLVDCAANTRKPTGYIRRFLEAHVDDNSMPCFAVDGPDEVFRIHDTVQMLSRRKGTNGFMSIGFLVRLPNDHDAWTSLIASTREAAVDTCNQLVGFSFDLFPTNQDPIVTDLEGDYLASFRNVIDEVSRSNFDDRQPNKVRIDVTGLPNEPSRTVTAWLTGLADSYSMVTVDASSILMANVGALCTRIIGVKDGDSTRHYYIDDGCYGSLYSGQGDKTFMPLPLFAVEESDHVVQSTVWGPTCDGLDKVCGNIPLPKLRVDEWLVFPNMGCGGGMGTAFNGFDPPDTAYCVLGYFRNK